MTALNEDDKMRRRKHNSAAQKQLLEYIIISIIFWSVNTFDKLRRRQTKEQIIR